MCESAEIYVFWRWNCRLGRPPWASHSGRPLQPTPMPVRWPSLGVDRAALADPNRERGFANRFPERRETRVLDPQFFRAGKPVFFRGFLLCVQGREFGIQLCDERVVRGALRNSVV